MIRFGITFFAAAVVLLVVLCVHGLTGGNLLTRTGENVTLGVAYGCVLASGVALFAEGFVLERLAQSQKPIVLRADGVIVGRFDTDAEAVAEAQRIEANMWGTYKPYGDSLGPVRSFGFRGPAGGRLSDLAGMGVPINAESLRRDRDRA